MSSITEADIETNEVVVGTRNTIGIARILLGAYKGAEEAGKTIIGTETTIRNAVTSTTDILAILLVPIANDSCTICGITDKLDV